MRIVINHLTRMQPGLMCAAGIDPLTGLHVRPVMGRPLPVELLERNGGPFALGRMLDLGETTFVGRMPEIEDRTFVASGVSVVEEWATERWLGLCSAVSGKRLVDIFGEALKPVESRFGGPATAAVPEKSGLHSLGCYWAADARLILVQRCKKKSVRLEFSEMGIRYSVAVTDYRLWNEDHLTPNEPEFARMAGLVNKTNNPVLLSVGLSRAHRFTDDEPPRHWLQVNNIHVVPGSC
ncbi:MAG: hypothetical protein ABL888_02470 [Pirellulaceae bacterium]